MTPDEIEAERERFEAAWYEQSPKVHPPIAYFQYGRCGEYLSPVIEQYWQLWLKRTAIARAEQAELRVEIERLRVYGIELLQLKFEEYSEARYFATWHDGIELAIWQAAANGDTWAQKIVECAQTLGVWLEWIDGEDGPTPVPLAEWRERMGGAG